MCKQGVICPILKPGKDPTQVNSYRSITLLSCIGKLMERIIQRRIEHYIESKHFPPNRTGYQRCRSTMDILAVLTHTIRQATIEEKHSLIVYIDIQGAFDSVWHQGLIYKIINLEFDSQLIRWIYHYLKGRTTCV
jgi:hypothetical protein